MSLIQLERRGQSVDTAARPEHEDLRPKRDPRRATQDAASARRSWLIRGLPSLIALVGVALTVGAISETKLVTDRENQVRREANLETLVQDVEARLGLYSESLFALNGLFQASNDVTRDEFLTFIGSTGVFDRLEGLQALEWVPAVERDELATYESSVRSDTTLTPAGYPDFEVHPASSADDLFVVHFLVPFEGNEAAFGFDLGSNPARREAVELARDTGQAVATEPITLVQEDGDQTGMLLMLPAFSAPDLTTIGQRREAFLGVVLAVFRVDDLLSGANSQVGVDFYGRDLGATGGTTGSEPEMIYNPLGGDVPIGGDVRTIDVGGRRWEITALPREADHEGPVGVLAIGAAGLVVSLAVAWLVHRLLTARDRADSRARELADGLRDATADIRRSNADLERFAHVASHDLKTPARNIGNLVELLRGELPEELNEDAREFLDLLDSSADRMVDLIQGLLEFSKIQSVNEDEAFEHADLNRVLEELVPLILASSGDAEVSIDWFDLPVVGGDERLVGQVFENLITNAIKYRDPDRRLAVAIAATRRDDQWELTVSDNGIGIDSRFFDKIFEMFSRLHKVNEYEGTGIGLALCRKIVERYGGAIWVESVPGQGSTFHFTLPICPMLGTASSKPDKNGKVEGPVKAVAAPSASPGGGL